MRFKCAQCQNIVTVASVSPQGDQVPCPHCGNLMLLTAPSRPAAAPVKPVPLRPQVVDDDVIDLPPMPQRAPVVRAMPVQQPPPQPPPQYRQPATTRSNDEQPVQRPRKKKKQKNLLPYYIGGGIGLAVLIVAGILLFNALNKDDAVKPMQARGNSDDVPSRRTSKKQSDENSDGVRRNTPPENNNPPPSNDNDNKPDSNENDRNSNPPPDTSTNNNNSNSNTGSSDKTESPGDTVQPSSFGGGNSEGSGADVYPYVLKSSTFIIAVSKDGRSVGAGSGSLIDVKNRLVLTNHHVAGDARQIAIFFPNYDKSGKLIASKETFFEQFRKKQGSVIAAKVIATNSSIDLCILQLQRLPAGVEAIPIAKQSCRVGQRVHSIGNPGSSGALWVYAPGVVRQMYRKTWMSKGEDNVVTNHNADVLETQSPTNHGDSGGPLVNDRGELVGVTQGGKTDGISSISIFIDVSEVKRFAEQSMQRHFKTAFVSDSRAPLSVGGATASNTGSGMSGTLPDLVKALSNAETKAKAAEALGAMGDKARDAIPSLMKLLADPDEFVRRTTMTALSKIGNPSKTDVPMLAIALADSNTNLRQYAATTLQKMGSDARAAASELIASIRDNDPVVRQAAARAVGAFGRDFKTQAKSALEEMLKDSDKDNRQAAAEGLANILAASGDMEGITKLLKHQDTEVRAEAVKASVRLGKNAKTMLPDLLAMAKDDTGETRKAVLKVLGLLDANDAKIGLTLVVDSLKSGDKETKIAALGALGNLAREVQPTMVAAVRDCIKDNDLKPACIETLKKLAPSSKASLVLLVELVKDDDNAIADAACNALVDLGSSASGAVVELIKLMDISGNVVTKSDEERVTKYANVLAKLGKTAIPTLRKGLASRSITRWGCVKALGEIGPPAREAVRDLQVLMQNEPNEFIRQDIAEAVRKILNQ